MLAVGRLGERDSNGSLYGKPVVDAPLIIRR